MFGAHAKYHAIVTHVLFHVCIIISDVQKNHNSTSNSYIFLTHIPQTLIFYIYNFFSETFKS